MILFHAAIRLFVYLRSSLSLSLSIDIDSIRVETREEGR